MLREPHGHETEIFDERAAEGWPQAAEWSAPATPASELVRLCRDLADGAGADGFGLFFLAAEGEARRLVPVFDSGFPGICGASQALSSPEADGFARRLAASATPLWWADANGAAILRGEARLWAAEVASPQGEGRAGIVFPTAGENGRSGALALFGDDILLDGEALCATHARAFALFAEVARLRPPAASRLPAMSKREIECLRLTANGFTSEEIAGALGLSVHTANQYLTSSAHKLNAVNRIHAVAKALRAGLID